MAILLRKYEKVNYCPDCLGKKQSTVIFDEGENWYCQKQSVVAIDCACGYQYVKKGFNIKLSERQTKIL